MSWRDQTWPTETVRPRSTKRTVVLVGLMIGWGLAVSTGLILLSSYENRPGLAATAPADWPAASGIGRKPGLPTLVMLVHPHCPCSRASIEELNRLLARAHEAMSVYVLFVKPSGVPEDWDLTDLWRSTAAIPGVHAMRDEGGVEAARFQAATSGQVVLYDAAGGLLFSGGITSSRGHEGDNVGSDTILSLLMRGRADDSSTPVFGCSLREVSTRGSWQ